MDPLRQALEAVPGLKNGGLREVKALYARYKETRVSQLLSTPSDADIVKAVRRLQGVHDFVTFLETEVNAEDR